MSDVEIKGLKELYIALSTQIPRKMEGKVLQKALTAGTAILVKQARANAVAGGVFPEKQSGTLQKAIYAKRGRTSDETKEVRFVSVRRGKRAAKGNKDAWYARLVEYGHRTYRSDVLGSKRLIRETTATTKKGFDRYENRRMREAGRKGRIKGSRSAGIAAPHPFMRPAWDSTQTASRDAIVAKLRELINSAVQSSRF